MYFLFTAILVLNSCSTTRALSSRYSFPTTFVFKNYTSTSHNGQDSLQYKQNFIIDAKDGDEQYKRQLKEALSEIFEMQKRQSELHIEVQNDSIWRYILSEDQSISSKFMIRKNDGILHYYDSSGRILHNKHNLFVDENKFIIKEDKSDSKLIQGFNCHKLVLTIINPENDLGNTIYEMYVTNKIDLPVHAVLNVTALIPKSFPLYIKISEENLPGFIEIYEIVSVK